MVYISGALHQNEAIRFTEVKEKVYRKTIQYSST